MKLIRKLRITAFFLALCIIFQGTCFTVTAEEESCESCHNTSQPDGDYILQEPALWIDAPPRVSPNETFKLSLVVTHYGIYEIKNLKAVLDLASISGVSLNGNENAEKEISKIGSDPQARRLTWQLKTGETSNSTEITMHVTYTSHLEHTAEEDVDEYNYEKDLVHQIEIKDMPITLNTWSIMTELGDTHTFYLEITALKKIYNVQIVPGRSVSDFTSIDPSTIGTLSEGQSENISIIIQPDMELDSGSIVIIWSTDEEGYEMDSVKIKMSISAKQSGGKISHSSADKTWLMGRIIGFMAFFMLLILITTGGLFKSVTAKLNKVFGGAKKRVTFHCAMSYQLLVIVLIHAALLMYGHYSSLRWNGSFLIARPDMASINLGTAALFIMFFIAVAGIFQKRIIRKTGHRNWRRLHGWLTFTALILIIAHLLLVGSTIGQPLRAALT